MHILINQIVKTVAPHAGAWIETRKLTTGKAICAVAPHAGAWIETCSHFCASFWRFVAPHAGAWIETPTILLPFALDSVAPHAGAWIETVILPVPEVSTVASRPTRARGLKHPHRCRFFPLLGSRAPRGRVD